MQKQPLSCLSLHESPLWRFKLSVCYRVKCYDIFFFFRFSSRQFYTMVLLAAAIRGHRSAHSLATGPVMAEPFISPFTFTITPALSSK